MGEEFQTLLKEFSYTKKDFILDWYSGSGAGGQRRNKVQCCLRLTHIPSGITVGATEYAHRNANLKLAFQRMKPLLIEWIRDQMNTMKFPKNDRVIRTYNEVDNRVTDETGNQYAWADLHKMFGQIIMDRKKSL